MSSNLLIPIVHPISDNFQLQKRSSKLQYFVKYCTTLLMLCLSFTVSMKNKIFSYELSSILCNKFNFSLYQSGKLFNQMKVNHSHQILTKLKYYKIYLFCTIFSCNSVTLSDVRECLKKASNSSLKNLQTDHLIFITDILSLKTIKLT